MEGPRSFSSYLLSLHFVARDREGALGQSIQEHSPRDLDGRPNEKIYATAHFEGREGCREVVLGRSII